MVLVSTESEGDMLRLTPLSLSSLTASASAQMQHLKMMKIQRTRSRSLMLRFKVSQLWSASMMSCLEIQQESFLEHIIWFCTASLRNIWFSGIT